jgi:cytochrome c
MARIRQSLLHAAAALTLGPPAALADPAALAAAAGCSGCHLPEQPMVGPSYADIAARYGDAGDALDMIAGRLRAGSQGTWGEVPMPPVSSDALGDEALRTVLQWILDR